MSVDTSPRNPTPQYQPILHVALYHPEIPYNTGNIGRSCVAVGAKLWLIEPLGFQINDYYLRRAGLDYWELLEWEIVPSWEALVQKLPAARYWLLTKYGTRHYTEVSYQPGDVLVFGSESSGLPPELVRERADSALRIPMRPEMRSLNLSNTAAILMYEALRQWSVEDTDSLPRMGIR
ncbi:MAG: tRNA (cytidine(34)-2'-O)-methyltransferase [Pirellulales bacterium]|nr:tRNA (cytidine(34)-2'-O)-methyltransferase [Pirellulales bacterium]